MLNYHNCNIKKQIKIIILTISSQILIIWDINIALNYNTVLKISFRLFKPLF